MSEQTSRTSALTVDVEAFAESHAQSVAVPSVLLDEDRQDKEIEHNLDVTLEFFARHGRRATFFFLGRIGRSKPYLVRRTAEMEHEIGCHSYHHVRITGQTPNEFGAQVSDARRCLEDASGTAVIGFRAPDFSIGEHNAWAFDELVKAGYQYDSSVVPTRIHDVYGMTGTPESIFKWPNGLIEFPLPIVHLPGLRLPIGGGGYFRLYPLWLTRRHFRQCENRHRPVAFYIHPYEIGPEWPRLTGLGPGRRLRHYMRLHNGGRRLDPLLRDIQFTTMRNVLKDAGYMA